MRYFHYAIQDKTGKWTGYLQRSWGKGEHGDEGSTRWLDPTKETYATEQEALDGALKLAADNHLETEFLRVEETDYRAGIAEVAQKDATGTDEQKMEAVRTAEDAEKARADAAKSRAGG